MKCNCKGSKNGFRIQNNKHYPEDIIQDKHCLKQLCLRTTCPHNWHHSKLLCCPNHFRSKLKGFSSSSYGDIRAGLMFCFPGQWNRAISGNETIIRWTEENSLFLSVINCIIILFSQMKCTILNSSTTKDNETVDKGVAEQICHL